MARKYVNPNRAAAGSPHAAFRGTHRHAHPAFGDELDHEHSHYGDMRHGPPAVTGYGDGRIMARARSADAFAGAAQDAADRARARDAEELRRCRPGMALDSEPWAASWGAFMAQLRTDEGQRRVGAAIRNAGLSERRGDEGAFLLPWRLAEQLFMYLTRSIVWPRAMNLEMGAYRLGLPYLDNSSASGGSQGLGGVQFEITESGQPVSVSNPQFGAQFLEAHKLAALISPVPNELPADAESAFSDLFGRVVGIGLGWEVDDLLINGTGAGEPEGILNAAAALPVSRANSGQPPAEADVVNLLKRLHPASKDSAVWLASEDTMDALLDLYLPVGSPTNAATAPSEWLRFCPDLGCWTLLGVPFYPSEHQPPAGTAGDLVLADLSLLAVGIQEAMTIERSQMGATFPSDASAWRIRTRLDSRYLAPGTYTLANGKVVSPITVLS